MSPRRVAQATTQAIIAELLDAAFAGRTFSDPDPLRIARATIVRREVGNGGFGQLFWNRRHEHRAGPEEADDTAAALRSISAKAALKTYRAALRRLQRDDAQRTSFFASNFFDDPDDLRKDLYKFTDGFDFDVLDDAIAEAVQGYVDKCVARFTVLLRAAEHGFRSLVEAALDAGVDINQRDQYGATLLLGAIRSRDRDFVRALIERGADTTPDKRGATVLHAVVYHPDVEVARVLVEAGVPVKARNPAYKGMTAPEMIADRMARAPSDALEALGAFLGVSEAPVVEALPAECYSITLQPEQAKEMWTLIVQEAQKFAKTIGDLDRLPEMVRHLVAYRRCPESDARYQAAAAAIGDRSLEYIQSVLGRLIPPPGTTPKDWGNNHQIHANADPNFIAWESFYWRLGSLDCAWAVAALLDAGLDVNQRFAGGTLLEFAFRGTTPMPMVDLLLARKSEVSPDALRAAAMKSPEALAKLLPHVSDVAAKSRALRYAVERKSPHVLEAVALLLDAGADVNGTGPDGSTAMRYAGDDAELMALLVGRGADPNRANKKYETALTSALARGALATADRLVQLDADVNAPAKKPVLIQAAARGDTKAVAWLVEKGVELDPVDAAGLTPLHHAAIAGWHKKHGVRSEWLQSIECLLQAGADVTIETKKTKRRAPMVFEAGSTVASVARTMDDQPLRALLERFAG